MKKILIAIGILLLAGCSSTIYGPEVIWANKMCEKKGGISLVEETFAGNFYAVCNNGGRYKKVSARYQKPLEE